LIEVNDYKEKLVNAFLREMLFVFILRLDIFSLYPIEKILLGIKRFYM
jgi:hypothetical protein